MEVTYHPLVKRDVTQVLRYYHEISPRLADEFHAELRELIGRAAEQPLRFHLSGREFRRINLHRFPYHVLYDVKLESMRVMVVRHNKRHPDYGLDRV
jgi:plasmid stabilization system protein ParE